MFSTTMIKKSLLTMGLLLTCMSQDQGQVNAELTTRGFARTMGEQGEGEQTTLLSEASTAYEVIREILKYGDTANYDLSGQVGRLGEKTCAVGFVAAAKKGTLKTNFFTYRSGFSQNSEIINYSETKLYPNADITQENVDIDFRGDSLQYISFYAPDGPICLTRLAIACGSTVAGASNMWQIYNQTTLKKLSESTDSSCAGNEKKLRWGTLRREALACTRFDEICKAQYTDFGFH